MELKTKIVSTTKFSIHSPNGEFEGKIPVLGDHNVNNALAAFIVATHYGVKEEAAIEALSLFEPGAMRQNIIKTNGITVINDCYNSSPSSMQAGLKTLRQISGSRKIAVLGDMLEIGELSERLHKDVGTYVVENKTDFLIAIGKDSKFIIDGACEKGFDKSKTKYFTSKGEAKEFLDKFIQKEDAILVKASRSMEFEEIVDYIIGF